jgi:hypothetical protein
VTVTEAQALVAHLLAAFPQVEVRGETAPTYVRYLLDLAKAAAEEAIEELILTSPSFPTIAAIRRRVMEGTLGLPSAAETWVAVGARDRQGELHALAKEARELVGGAWAIRTSDNPSITRAQFLKVYDELRERALVQANRDSRRGRATGSADG